MPIAMYVGIQDYFVDVSDNRKIKAQLGENLISYQELEFDHNSFILANDMSYFQDVLKVLEKYNPSLKKVDEELKEFTTVSSEI